jgi:hypothetical protein
MTGHRRHAAIAHDQLTAARAAQLGRSPVGLLDRPAERIAIGMSFGSALRQCRIGHTSRES